MANEQNTPLDHLWQEYAEVFHDFDDLTLARWMAQTLGQLKGRTWRLSHPLIGAYRLAAQVGVDRQVWLKRLATVPADYLEAPCCRAPLLPLFTRDVVESGLVCEHCGGTAVEFNEIDASLLEDLKLWTGQYTRFMAWRIGMKLSRSVCRIMIVLWRTRLKRRRICSPKRARS